MNKLQISELYFMFHPFCATFFIELASFFHAMFPPMRPLILVVEDEPSIQELIRFNLEQADYEVTTCDSGISLLMRYKTGA